MTCETCMNFATWFFFFFFSFHQFTIPRLLNKLKFKSILIRRTAKVTKDAIPLYYFLPFPLTFLSFISCASFVRTFHSFRGAIFILIFFLFFLFSFSLLFFGIHSIRSFRCGCWSNFQRASSCILLGLTLKIYWVYPHIVMELMAKANRK